MMSVFILLCTCKCAYTDILVLYLSSRGAQTCVKVNLVRIQCANPDSTFAWLPQFNGDFHVQGYMSLVKSSWGSYHLFSGDKPNCRKMFYLAMLKNPWKKIPGSESGCGWRPKFNHHVNLWKNCHEDPFGSFNLKLLTDRQTYMYKRRALHNLVGGGNRYIRVWYRELVYRNVSSQTNLEHAAVR